MITQDVTPMTPLPSFLAPERPAAVDNLVEVELPLLTEELDEVINQINSTETSINNKETSVTDKYNSISSHFDEIDLVAAAIQSGDLPTIIDDANTSVLKTWSSEKIDSEIDIHSKTAKTTPVDTDEIMIADSASAWSLKKITWANIVTKLKSLFNIDVNGNIGSGTQSFNGFGGSGFKNLIINGNKQVNQSGLTTTDNAYNYDNHYKVGNNWFQFISGKNIVSGESYTLSWEGSDTAGYYIGTAGALTINAQTFIPIANGETITLTITSSQILWIKFASNSSGSTYNKVQLEPGTIPTPYEHRLYELEESLVQNCYEIVNFKCWNIATASNQILGGSAYYKKVKDKIPVITTVAPSYSNSHSIATESVNVDSLYVYALSSASGQLSYRSTFHCDARPY